MPAVTRSMFAALKPGGLLLVIDHVARGVHAPRYRNPASHRSRNDPARDPPGWISARVGKHLLHNPRDAHVRRVFDPAIRERTDQVVLKFRKPIGPA